MRPEPITAAAFAAYGRTIAASTIAGRTVAAGRTDICPAEMGLDAHDPAAVPLVEVYRVRPSALPLTVARMERHPHSAQLFVPMRLSRSVVVVARGTHSPDPTTLRAFTAGPDDVVAYARGTWHLSVTVLDEEAVFATTFWRTGAGDTEFVDLDAPVTITL